MSLTAEVGMDVMLNIGNAARTVNDIEKTIGAGVDKGLTGSLKNQQKKITQSYAKALVGALRLSDKAAAQNLRSEFKQRTDLINRESRAVRTLESQLDNIKDKKQKARIREMISASKDTIKNEQRAVEQMAEKQMAYQRESLAMLDKGMKKSARSFGEKLEGSVEGFQDILSSAMGDPSEFIKKMSGKAKDSSSDVFTFGAKMAGGGGKMAKVGKLIMGLGKYLPLIAGIGVAVAGMVALFAAAYGQTKEWNKALLETGSAFDIAGSAGGDLGKGLETLRESVSVTSRRFGIATDEVLKYLGAFNEAGVTFEEMKGLAGTTDALTAFNQVQRFGIKFTRSLGIEMSDLASLTHQMHEQLGMDLRGIDDSLQGIAGQAQAAGMSTRSFFSAISEATSGMALYNFRLEDTSELLLELVDVLGEDLAKQTLGMEGVFRGAGTEERVKATMTGGGALKSVLAATGKRQVEGFFEDLSQAGRGVLKAEGFIGKGGKINYEKLGSLKGPELARVMRALKAEGVQATAFRDVTRQAAGVTGGMGARADALGAADRTGELAAKIAQGMGVLNVSDFGSLRSGTADRMAFENMTGIQGEEFDKMALIFNDLQFLLSEQKGRDVSLEETLTAFAAGEIESPEAAELAKKLDEQHDPAMSMAEQQLDATRTVGDILGTTISGLLNWIGGGITRLVDAFIMSEDWGGDIENERAIAQAGENAKSQSVLMGSLREQIREAEGKKDFEKAEALEAQMVEAERVRGLYEREADDIAGGVDRDEAKYSRLEGIYGSDMTAQVVAGAVSSGDTGDIEFEGGAVMESMMQNSITNYGGIEPALMAYLEKDEEGMATLESLLEDQQTKNEADAQAEIEEQEKQTKEQEEIESGIQAVIGAIRDSNEESRRLAFDQVLAGSGLSAEKAIEMLRGGQGGAVASKIKRDEEGKISREAAGFLRYYGGRDIVKTDDVKDFIYRGDARGGMITPIDTADQFIGMKPGGAIDRAGGLGRSIVISNLTINESGNPQRTLQMVKQAIAAASRG